MTTVSKWDLYKTAKVKNSAPVEGAGEYVRILGNVNHTIFHIEFINGDVRSYHRCHLENFVL